MRTRKYRKSKILESKSEKPAKVPCTDCCDLLLLRDAAADKRKAIAFYLTAALETSCPRLFFAAAEDAMQHYIAIMQEISRLDRVQALKLQEEGLEFLTAPRPLPRQKLKWAAQVPEAETADVEISPPTAKDLANIQALTQALADEFYAVNKYQTYMDKAEDCEVAELFCKLMNDGKEHIAQFTAALFEITQEPLIVAIG